MRLCTYLMGKVESLGGSSWSASFHVNYLLFSSFSFQLLYLLIFLKKIFIMIFNIFKIIIILI